LCVSYRRTEDEIFDNFIASGSYTQKQFELINKIKNIIFGKTYRTIHDSLVSVKEQLFSDIHPLSSELDSLSDQEQSAIFSVIQLIDKVDTSTRGYLV
jgi:flagellar motor switch protein FliG